MAVESDYDFLINQLNELDEFVTGIKLDVDRRVLQEKAEASHRTRRAVDILASQLIDGEPPLVTLRLGAASVLRSRPGEQVFPDEPAEPELAIDRAARRSCCSLCERDISVTFDSVDADVRL